MNHTVSLSAAELRRLFLARQGLLRTNHFGRGTDAVGRAIDALGYVQIDTISVVDRAHHHVLKERVSNFDPESLNKLQRDRREIFEYWSHAAAYLPVKDYRFYRPMMEGFRQSRSTDEKLSQMIMARIRTEGPVQSRDFENPGGSKGNGWWDWKPAKRALEHLFLSGELMVSHREGFQKVFDLPERVLPASIGTHTPDSVTWAEFLLTRMVDALGAGTLQELSYSRTAIRQFNKQSPMPDYQTALQNLLEKKELTEVAFGNETLYTRQEFLEQIPARVSRQKIRFLSPFDNLLINRKRTSKLFGFDYLLECYVPEPKRRYGYFCLPVLWGDQLIGRVDAKADRKQKRLIIHLLQVEPQLKSERFPAQLLNQAIEEFALRHQCESWEVRRIEAEPPLSNLFSQG